MSRKSKVLMFLMMGVIVFFIVGIYIAPNNPNQVNLAARFLEPCMDYPLGTDYLGRCIFSRLLYGGRTTIGIVLVGGIIILIVGTPIGLLAGQVKEGNILGNSLLNAVTAIPPIAYLLIFVGAWGNGIVTMLVAMTVSLLLRLIKIVKTRTKIEITKAYALCAITSGASKMKLLFREILPNVIEDELHYLCLSCADMILAITGFSFIGIGLGDNVIDWGMMVSESRESILSHPENMLYPVLAIVICTISFNYIARVLEKGEERC